MTAPRRGMTALAWTLALTPFALAVLAHTARPSLPMSIPAPDRPPLVFDQYLVDLGPVEPSTEVRALFLFENRGDKPVELLKIAPSCGCLEPQVSTRNLAPGATGRMALRMQPANELPGRKEYYADISYSDGQPRDARVTFRVEIPEQQLTVRPRALVFYQMSDQPTTQTLTVTDNRAEPVRVLGATVNSPFVQLRLQAERTEDGVSQTEFEITVAANLPAGRHEAIISVETTDPKSPVLRVPLLMEGRRSEEASP
ncbi:MAG: DUF1573 domain-containing protein [Planctomycetaceae bacterium]|nr:DUF1573 domain-containing protein [Planctomycetaceae bacterium]